MNEKISKYFDKHPSKFTKRRSIAWFNVFLIPLFLASQTSLLFLTKPASAQTGSVCATPGKDGTGNQNTVVNSYFPAATGATAIAGNTSLSIGSYHTGGASTPISPGDMLMIIQMQDASINSTNTTSYGSGIAANNGTGQTNLNNTGKYEFVYATNSVPTIGGTLTFQGGGAGGGLVNNYVNAAPTATRGRRTFQIVRVVQYASLTLGSNITVPDWNGSSGGVLALDIAGDVDFNGRVIDGSGKGFRGGYQPSGASG
ncbi:MAG: hypothetical protein ACRC2V_13575, partial [Xenococcaceae cyanobacterium]